MQVDVGTLKATLLELPTLGQASHKPRIRALCVSLGPCRAVPLKSTTYLPTHLGQANATAIYTRLVTSEIKRAEQILKLVQTPPELLEVTVEELRNEVRGPATAREGLCDGCRSCLDGCRISPPRVLAGVDRGPGEDSEAKGDRAGRAGQDHGGGVPDERIGVGGRQEDQEALQRDVSAGSRRRRRVQVVGGTACCTVRVPCIVHRQRARA